MDTYLPYVGYVQFPRRPEDLARAVCPACFAPRNSAVCIKCGLDLANPAIAELDASSADAAASLDRRLELIGRIRYETSAAAAATAAPAPVPVAAPTVPWAAPVSTVGPPAPAPAASAPAPAASAPRADAPPRRHLGVQVILLIVGVSLLSVGAIFFLVYAFITFGLVWRSIIIGAVTVAAIVGATLLRRRRLTVTAEAIAALGVVFVYLDAFAIRANDLFGSGDSDALAYWGLTLVISALAFAVWHRLSGLRLPNIVAFIAFAPGVALLAAGLSEPLDDGIRVFIAFAALAVGALVHALAQGRRAERVIALSLAIAGLVAAALTALVMDPGNDWAPAIGLGVVALIALVHVVAVVAGGTSARLGSAIAAIGAAALSFAALAVATRVTEPVFLAIAPAVTAAVIALALELLARMAVPPVARSAARAAAWAAAAVAAIALLVPLGTSLVRALSIAADGAHRWTLPGGSLLVTLPEHAASVGALALVVLLVAGAWALGGILRARRTIVLSAAIAVLVLAVPLLGVRWAVVAGWLVLGAVGVAALVRGRARGWGAGIRIPLLVGSIVAVALGYAASWASLDTWWFGSIGAIGLLVAARLATANHGIRGALTGVAAVLGLVAIGFEGWDLNHWFSDGTGAGLDALHLVLALAIVLVALAAVLANRALSALETRVLFWLCFATAGTAAGISWALAADVEAVSLVLPEFGTSLVLGLALLGTLLAWVLPRSLAAYGVERIVASVAIAPSVAWVVDSFCRALSLPEFVTAVAPISAALLVSAGVLALALLRPSGARWAREIGVGLVALPALFSALVWPSDATWLVLLLGGVTALLLAVSSDGLFGSASPRRHLGWAALALAAGGLWWRLGSDGVRALEPYVLPLAGALLLVSLLVWRARRTSTAAPFIALAGLFVGILPIAAQSVSGPVERAIAVTAVSAALLLLGSFVRGSQALRPYLDAAALAGAVGVVVAGFGRPIRLAIDGRTGDTAIDLWLALSFLLLLAAAIGQARVLDERTARLRAIGSQVLGGAAILAVMFVMLSVIRPGALGVTRAAVVLLVFCVIHVVGLLLDRAPFSAPVGWTAIAAAAVVGFSTVVTDVVHPLEWASVAIGAALIVVGAVMLRRSAGAGSWPWLAPGILVVLLPSLIATFTDQPGWRLVALGLACVVAIVVGAVWRLQAPLLIGTVIVLVHAIRTFAPQLVAVYQLTEWWVWAVVGGAIIVFVAVTFERRVRDLKAVGGKISALR